MSFAYFFPGNKTELFVSLDQKKRGLFKEVPITIIIFSLCFYALHTLQSYCVLDLAVCDIREKAFW